MRVAGHLRGSRLRPLSPVALAPPMSLTAAVWLAEAFWTTPFERTDETQAGYAPPTAHPTDVSLALRGKGWVPYRIWFEPEEDLWVAKVIDWGRAA